MIIRDTNFIEHLCVPDGLQINLNLSISRKMHVDKKHEVTWITWNIINNFQEAGHRYLCIEYLNAMYEHVCMLIILYKFHPILQHFFCMHTSIFLRLSWC